MWKNAITAVFGLVVGIWLAVLAVAIAAAPFYFLYKFITYGT